MDTILDFLLTFGILGGMAFIVAQMSKDRDIGFWTLFAISVFLTPFIGIFVALISKKRRSVVPGVQVDPENVKETQSKFWQRFAPKRDEDENDDSGNSPPPYGGRMQSKDKPNGKVSL